VCETVQSHWRAIAGVWAPHKGGGTPRDFGPCGTVLDRNVPLLFSHPERDFPYFGEVTPLLEEALLVPFYIRGEAVGTIWVVSHDQKRRFDAEDLRVLTNLATFSAAAYQSQLALTDAQRIASIVNSSTDAIVSKNLKGTIKTWNQGAARLFGYMAEEIVGQNISVLIPPDRQDEEHAIIERIQRGEHIEHYETIRVRKGGTLVPISLSVSPVRNNDGKIIGASKVARDISERKQKEEHIALLSREVDHRSKNLLSLVQATVRLAHGDTPDALKKAIEGRIPCPRERAQLVGESALDRRRSPHPGRRRAVAVFRGREIACGARRAGPAAEIEIGASGRRRAARIGDQRGQVRRVVGHGRPRQSGMVAGRRRSDGDHLDRNRWSARKTAVGPRIWHPGGSRNRQRRAERQRAL
jgi:PAS domain S-box-containing protein